MSHPKPTNTAQVYLPLPAPYLHALLINTVKQQVATVQQCSAYNTTPTVQAVATSLLASAATRDREVTPADAGRARRSATRPRSPRSPAPRAAS